MYLINGNIIRKLWNFEEQLYRDHLLRLDPESRRSRFGGAVSDEFISSYAEPRKQASALIHGFFVAGTLRGAADLRPLPAEHEAEVAFSIEKPWQSHGVGTALLEQSLLVARNRGIKFLHMVCLAENRRMRKLARKFHAHLKIDSGTLEGEVEAPRPTAMSLFRELVADGTGLVTAVLGVQSRLLEAASLLGHCA
jgi:GNAT superfamily N-acetyltransferase